MPFSLFFRTSQEVLELFFLTVIRIRSVLAPIMFLDEQRVHLCVWVDNERDKSHLCTLFHDLSVIHSVGG